MKFQAFLLRHNLLGPLGNELMVVTTIGRKTGRRFSTPVGYLRDGDTIIALSIRGESNWYRNMLHNQTATLEIKGRPVNVRAEPVTNPAQRQKIFELYCRERAGSFKLLFGVPSDAPTADLERALASRQFVRFYPEKGLQP